MGSGIAAISAQQNYRVNVVDIDTVLLKKSEKHISKTVQRFIKCKKPTESDTHDGLFDSIMSNIVFTTDISKSVAESNLVIEAIVENLESKKKLFGQIDDIAPSSCIFASNTSSLPIGAISEAVTRKALFGGLHFFNPVPAMRLVEVVKTSDTSDATIMFLTEFARSLDKRVVHCKDTPGFIVNRLLVPYIIEAIKMVEERKEASVMDVDAAMRLGAGHPMGPFELADYVGLDTLHLILSGWVKSCPHEPAFKACRALEEYVHAGRLGRKSGHGFYQYDEDGRIVPQ